MSALKTGCSSDGDESVKAGDGLDEATQNIAAPAKAASTPLGTRREIITSAFSKGTARFETLCGPVGFRTDKASSHSGLLAGSCANGRRQVSPSLAQESREPAAMIDALERRLIEALESVDAHGDVAPAHIHDPMTMLLRENVVQTYLVRWDDGRGRYVLTGTGRRRISAGSRAPGTVVSSRNR